MNVRGKYKFYEIKITSALIQLEQFHLLYIKFDSTGNEDDIEYSDYGQMFIRSDNFM